MILGPSLYTIIFVIGITSWPSTARVDPRAGADGEDAAATSSVRGRSARGDFRLITRHILPNVGPADLREHRPDRGDRDPVRDDAVVPRARRPDVNISWGTILEQAFGQGAAFSGYWWWLVPPGVAIVLVVLSFTMIGYALDDILNPKLRGR